MHLRPQAHDIIRTWLFSTVLRAHLETDTLPWTDAAISGWVLDPDRKKMSKSKGNVVTPMALLEEHGSDAVRYWAAKGGPGVDTAFEPGQMKVGRRLAIKLFNASKFVLMKDAPVGPVTEPYDLAMLAALRQVVSDVSKALDAYDYASALRTAESFFWAFCDDYVEMVKRRRMTDDGAAASAIAASRLALSVQLRLFAPFLPFVTEEVWSGWQDGSVHTAPWPTASEIVSAPGGGGLYQDVSELLSAVRAARSDKAIPFKVPVRLVSFTMTKTQEQSWLRAQADIVSCCNIAEVVPRAVVATDAAALKADVEPLAP